MFMDFAHESVLRFGINLARQVTGSGLHSPAIGRDRGAEAPQACRRQAGARTIAQSILQYRQIMVLTEKLGELMKCVNPRADALGLRRLQKFQYVEQRLATLTRLV